MPLLSLRADGIVVADYPFSDVVWTTVVLVALVLFLFLVIAVLADAFRRDDVGVGKKLAWTLFVVVVPVVGVFAYLIANGDGMGSRRAGHGTTGRPGSDDGVVTGIAAAEIERAKRLLADGAITQAEYEAIRAKLLT